MPDGNTLDFRQYSLADVTELREVALCAWADLDRVRTYAEKDAGVALTLNERVLCDLKRLPSVPPHEGEPLKCVGRLLQRAIQDVQQVLFPLNPTWLKLFKAKTLEEHLHERACELVLLSFYLKVLLSELEGTFSDTWLVEMAPNLHGVSGYLFGERLYRAYKRRMASNPNPSR